MMVRVDKSFQTFTKLSQADLNQFAKNQIQNKEYFFLNYAIIRKIFCVLAVMVLFHLYAEFNLFEFVSH